MTARTVFIIGAVTSAVLVVTAIVMTIVAIWSVGPNSDRWGATGAVIGFVGILGLISALGFWAADS